MGVLYEYGDGDLYLHHTRSEVPDPGSESFSMQLHDRYEVYLCLGGRGDFVVEGFAYPLEAGMIMLLRPGEAHNLHLEKSEPYERISLLFAPRVAEQTGIGDALLDCFGTPEDHGICLRRGEYNTRFVTLLTEALRPLTNGPDEGRLAILGNLPALLLTLRAAHRKKRRESLGGPSGVVGEILGYIGDHLTDSWTLLDLQEALHRNRDHLNRTFKDVMGCGIWEYTLRKRIITARARLMAGEALSAVFETSGFSDYSSFYRQYRKIVGSSPSADAP